MVVEALKTIMTIRKLSGPEICHGAAVICGVTSGLDHITNSNYLKGVRLFFSRKKSPYELHPCTILFVMNVSMQLCVFWRI